MRKFILFLLCSSVAMAQHPFDDLSAVEIKQAVQIVKKNFSPQVKFVMVKRFEPLKKEWLGGQGSSLNRQAQVVVYDTLKNLMTDVTIDLKQALIVNKKELPGLTPLVLTHEFDEAGDLVSADPRWKKALADRKIDEKEVITEVWAPGLLSKEERKPGQRILRAIAYHNKGGKGKNFYSRPIEGLIATVDLVTKKVLTVIDLGVIPVAHGMKELDRKSQGELAPKLKPIKVVQPEGASFKIKGQSVEWFKWKFRFSLDPLQGLQLFHITYNDGVKDRSIMYKISLAEMVVPYGDPAINWSFRNAFDVGEYGLGKTLHPLVKNEDVPANAHLIDITYADDDGEPVEMKGAAIYEKSAGLLWKHRNSDTGDTDLRMARELVMTFMTTIGNYDYGINYIFTLDGHIRIEPLLTGILLPKGSAMETNPCTAGCTPLVEKNIIAPPHQHFFNFRMDLDVDGPVNSPVEMNVEALPMDDKNPQGNAFAMKNTILESEKEAVGSLNLPTARKWKVMNSESKNALGHPTGYALMGGENSIPYLNEKNMIRKRAGFINHHIWFTVYKDDEQSAAAFYPTTAPEGEGLPRYIRDDEKLENADVVMWYTLGITHVPRPEEWPIMNVHHTGFQLMPVNFFNENPGMKVR
jgi:primary-amine oxidase